MYFRLPAAVLAVCLCAAAQTTLSVEQLVSFIKSSIELKQSDAQVAKFLHGVRMKDRLDDRTIEELQGLGAGPKTLESLRGLRDQSQALAKAELKPPPPPPAPIPPPSSEEQGRIIEEVRDNALHYTKSLPNFICTQVTRRYADPAGRDSFQLLDTLTARLSYFEQKEDYKLILINNRMTDQAYQSLGGATSTGEFGSMLREIFEPRTQARFDWDHWATLRGKRAYVFSYRVLQPNSQWHINYERRLDIVPGYHGLIYIERDTRMVLRITLEADGIPSDFPVQMAKTVLDYDYSKIAERDFLLPLRAEVNMRADRVATRNDVEFRLYRRYTAEAEIKYDTPAPLPDTQTKEQSPK